MTMIILRFLFLVATLMPITATGAEVTKHTTPSGHIYWHYPVADAKRMAIAFNWPTGLTNLPKGQEMAARIGINVMLNGGAAEKSPDEIIANFDDLDAGMRLLIRPDQIRGFIISPNDSALEAASIVNDVLKSPTVDKRWFERERNKLFNAGRGRDSNIWGVAWTLSRKIMIGGHPYENYWSMRPLENIKKIEVDTIRKWHADAFATDGVVITTAGNADFDLIGKAIDKVLEGLPSGRSAKRHQFDGFDIPAKTVVYHTPWAKKSAILILANIPPPKARSNLELKLATSVLGFGAQSRLNKAIRTGLRASYKFGSRHRNQIRGHRILEIGGEVETSQLHQALDITRETYEEFRHKGIEKDEFEFAQRFYNQQIESQLKKPESVVHLLMDTHLDGMQEDFVTTFLQRISDLDRGTVNAFIKTTYPPFDSMLKIIVTPDADAIEGACVISAYDEWDKCLQ